MKTTLTLLPVIAVSALASCAGMKTIRSVPVSYQAGATQESPVPSSQSDLIFNDVNSYRQSIGAPALERHPGLDRLAQKHCEYLRQHRGTFTVYGKNVSHMGDAGRSLVAIRVFNMKSTSENVAWIEPYGNESQVAEGLVTLWRNSSDHDYAMRCADWTHTGVGAVVDADGSVFATQLFSTTNYSQMTTRQRFTEY